MKNHIEELKNNYERGQRMELVKRYTRVMLEGNKNKVERAKPYIKNEIIEYGYEVAGIKVESVNIWDNGSVDIYFGENIND